ncbi:MAG TPA: alpha-glucosidase C-terminal domain-containing protein, partial [Chloroflexota bacterium]|nr:alpha-glucosidase C-terminal domain-containing protein [Chloroflexota bacterium]
YLRQYRDQTVLCVANISRSAQPVMLDLNEYEGRIPVEMLGYVPFPKITEQPYVLTLSPYAFLWFELQLSSDGAELPAGLPEALPSEAAIDVDAWDAPPVLLQQAQAAQSEVAEGARAPAITTVEVGASESDRGTKTDLLILLEPGSREELDKTTATVVAGLASADRPMRTLLAYPAPDSDGAGPTPNTPQPVGGTPWLRLLPFVPSGRPQPSVWPHTVQTFSNVSHLAAEHGARATMLLRHDSASMDRRALLMLSGAVLGESADLAMPFYTLSPYEGLLNSAILHPLTRALYGSTIRYPLSADLAVSAKFSQVLGNGSGYRSADEDAIVWPATEAVLTGCAVAQVQVGHRHFAPREGFDVTALLTRVVGALFADIETRASDWQQTRVVARVREIGSRPAADATRDPSPPADVRPMIEQFRLASTHLQEIWGQVMTPRTLLAVNRLAQSRENEHLVPDALWVRIVYDFLAAYRGRTVNRNHLLGALLPLYLGWAASHVLAISSQGEAVAEQRVAALASAFEADKPYLLARWRWPDRFNP